MEVVDIDEVLDEMLYELELMTLERMAAIGYEIFEL